MEDDKFELISNQLFFHLIRKIHIPAGIRFEETDKERVIMLVERGLASILKRPAVKAEVKPEEKKAEPIKTEVKQAAPAKKTAAKKPVKKAPAKKK